MVTVSKATEAEQKQGSTEGHHDSGVHIQKTEFWHTVMKDVYGPRKGGAIIFVDAQNARKGVAKTSGAVALARIFAAAFGYSVKKEDMSLAGSQYLRRYQEQPGWEQPSVLVLDEFVGAGAGDARRAMSTENVDFGRAWQLLRAKRVITLATLPDWNEADPRLQKYADYRIWCREKPMGYFQPYKVTVPFHSAGQGTKVKLQGLGYGDRKGRRIQFPNMDAKDDPYYRHLTQTKDELIESGTWDASDLDEDGEDDEEQLTQEELERRELIKVAIRLYKPWDDSNDVNYNEVARAIEAREKSWVGNRVREWKNGEHRDLVADPTKND